MSASDRAAKTYPDGTLRHRYMKAGERRFNLRLDEEIWSALQEITEREGVTVGEVCARVAKTKPWGASISTSVRAYVVRYFRDAATEQGHRKAGHGRLRRARRKKA
jgi:predicted DNA-binding ribbon-helix-helix protein